MMNSVFSAFKSNKNGSSVVSTTTCDSSKKGHGPGKKILNLDETNNYEKLRHIREKMSNLVLDDDEINLRKPQQIQNVDECDSIQKVGKAFDCIANDAPSGFAVCNLSSSSSSSSLNTISLASIKKHYNQDNSENYSSENNILSKCCNGATNLGSASNASIVDTSAVTSSASATNLLMSLNDASESASSIFDKQPQPNNNQNSSNSNRNRPRLSLSSVNTSLQQQPAVHGRNSGNGLPTGRTRLSTHQRNLSLDFR